MCDVETEEKVVLPESITERGTPPTCCTVEMKEEDGNGSNSVEEKVMRTFCVPIFPMLCLKVWLYPSSSTLSVDENSFFFSSSKQQKTDAHQGQLKRNQKVG